MRHEHFMQRCIDLAKNGLGTTYPNPLVGSVIVHKDTIIGEGWHRKAGEAHAEVNAVNSVKDQSLLKESTLYVNLEPCSHFGKTPPCADMIIRMKIPNVVVGAVDPNQQVAGKGIEKLRAAGIDVTVGILDDVCLELNSRFFTFHNKKRPYIILKWAESADGFLAPTGKDERNPVWITSQASRQLVHKWRSEEASILVGTQTVVDDNPRLNVRDWNTINQPIRLVIDKSGRIPAASHIFDNEQKTVVFSKEKRFADSENLTFETVDFGLDILPQMLDAMHRRGIQSVIVEGGNRTLQSFIDAGLWDEARIFVGQSLFGNGTKSPTLNRRDSKENWIDKDKLLMIRNHDQHHYF